MFDWLRRAVGECLVKIAKAFVWLADRVLPEPRE
jgi:hypothetical protein